MPRNLIAEKLVLSSLIMGAASFVGQAADTANRDENVHGRIIGNAWLQNNDENAMDPAKLSQLKKCVSIIYNKVPTLSASQVQAEYNNVLNFINGPECRNKFRLQPAGAPQLPLMNPINLPYAEMYRNALFALTGLQGPQEVHHYNPLGFHGNEYIGTCDTDHGVQQVGMKELLARVWTLISNHQNLQDVEKMRSLLLKNLNDCVEDDGHLVCNIGKAERLMQSIEGYIEGVNFAVVLPEPVDFCRFYENELLEKLSESNPEDPLNFFLDLIDLPDTFTIENLEDRIKNEREAVNVRINGMYGANSQKAYAALNIMEEKFVNWKKKHYENNDNLTAEQKAAGIQAVDQNAASDKQARQEARRALEARQTAERPVERRAEEVRYAPERQEAVRQAAEGWAAEFRQAAERRAAEFRQAAERRAAEFRQAMEQRAAERQAALRRAMERPVVQPVVQQPVQPVIQQPVQPVVQHLTPKQAKAAQRAAARQNKAAQRAVAQQAKQQARQNKAAQRALAQQAKQQARQNKAAQRAVAQQAKQQARQNKAAQRAAARRAR